MVESDGSAKKRVVCPPSPPRNWVTAKSLDSVTSLTQTSPDFIMVLVIRACPYLVWFWPSR